MSNRPVVTLVYPLDPWGPKVGGSVGFIRGLVENAPPNLELRFIGITCDPERRPPLQWRNEQLDGRRIEFLPVLYEPREDLRRRIPLSLRFVLRVRPDMIPGDGAVVVHNRPETIFACGMDRHRNLVFIHNDVPAQVASGPGEVLWSRFPWLYYRFERRVFRLADRVYTVSTNTLNDCLRRYPQTPGKFVFVPTWVDSARFALSDERKPALRARLVAGGPDIDVDAPWVLFVGRLQPQKAPQRLLDAFLLLRQRHPRAQLIVIGDGNLRAAVTARVRSLGLASCAHLLGVLHQSELPAYYRAADILVLASDFEGMPMCVLEALACGLPVVTTRVGEVTRVVLPGATGEISDQASAHGVFDALSRALDHLDIYDRHACVEVVRPYSPQHVLEPVYARIDELTRRDGAGRVDCGSR